MFLSNFYYIVHFFLNCFFSIYKTCIIVFILFILLNFSFMIFSSSMCNVCVFFFISYVFINFSYRSVTYLQRTHIFLLHFVFHLLLNINISRTLPSITGHWNSCRFSWLLIRRRLLIWFTWTSFRFWATTLLWWWWWCYIKHSIKLQIKLKMTNALDFSSCLLTW